MSPRNVDEIFQRILDEIVFVRSLEASGALDRYPMDPVVKRATERSLELVGESVAQLRRARTELADGITDAALIVDFRNTLAHAFWKIDPVIVRFVIQAKLPTLFEEVVALRGDERPG